MKRVTILLLLLVGCVTMTEQPDLNGIYFDDGSYERHTYRLDLNGDIFAVMENYESGDSGTSFKQLYGNFSVKGSTITFHATRYDETHMDLSVSDEMITKEINETFTGSIDFVDGVPQVKFHAFDKELVFGRGHCLSGFGFRFRGNCPQSNRPSG